VRQKTKLHDAYYAVFPMLELKKITRAEAAKALGLSQRTFDDKVLGYSDFTLSQARIISSLLDAPQAEIFLT